MELLLFFGIISAIMNIFAGNTKKKSTFEDYDEPEEEILVVRVIK